MSEDREEYDEPIGPWGINELRQTAREEAGTGAGYELEEPVRFVSGVAKLVRRRRARPEAAEDPSRLAVFLLQPNSEDPRCQRRLPMLDNGLTALNGRVWFVNSAVVSGRPLDLADRSDDEVFRLVTEDLRLGSTPAIVLDPRLNAPEVRYYPQGLVEVDSYESLNLDCSLLQLADIFGVIDRVYASCLVTPDAQAKSAKLWTNKEQWVPSGEAEDFIQVQLKAGLAGAFPTCTIRHEQPMPVGRLDLIVEEHDPLDRHRLTRHAVLELKVLRSYRGDRVSPVSDQETSDWIKSGVKQAHAYRREQNARATALCCFDMRKEDTGEECFVCLRELAEKLGVALRRWYLYAKSEYHRDAIAAAR